MVVSENMRTRAASKVLLDKLFELLFINARANYIAEKSDVLGLLSVCTHSRLAKTLMATLEPPKYSWTMELFS